MIVATVIPDGRKARGGKRRQEIGIRDIRVTGTSINDLLDGGGYYIALSGLLEN